MSTFLVSVMEKEDGIMSSVVCKTRQKLSDLVLNLDSDRFEIVNIMTISSGLSDNQSEFYKENEELEKGEK